MNERHFHEQVADYLNLALIPPTWWTTFPSDGASRRGRIGLKLGVPDILVIHEGRAFWIELKGPRGRESDHQRATARALRGAGCQYALCLSLEAVIIMLTTWDIPLRPIDLAS